MTVMEAHVAELQSAGGKEPPGKPARSSAVTEPFSIRLLVVLIGLSFIGLFLILPLVAVFVDGVGERRRAPISPPSPRPMRSRRSG